MTELEAWKIAEKYDRECFESWWKNEAKEHMTYFPEEGEVTIYNLCLTSWLNGAYKAREFDERSNTKT